MFHAGRNNQKFSYNLYGQSLQSTEAEKDIGVILTPDLRPSKMVAKVASGANQVLGAWARAVSWRDKVTWVQIYKTYIRPKLEYCSQAWSPWTVADREALEKVQRRAVGMVTTLPKDMRYEEKLELLGLSTLEERRERGDMIQMYRSLGGQDTVGHKPFFTLESESQRQGPATRAHTGHLNVVLPAPARTEQRRNFWSRRSAATWNALSDGKKCQLI